MPQAHSLLSSSLRPVPSGVPLGSDVLHRTNKYLNNQLEQDHRSMKQRYYPMRGFGSFTSAARISRTFDEVRQFFRFRVTKNQSVPLAQQRTLFRQRLEYFQALVLSAWLQGEWMSLPLLFPLFSVLTYPSSELLHQARLSLDQCVLIAGQGFEFGDLWAIRLQLPQVGKFRTTMLGQQIGIYQIRLGSRWLAEAHNGFGIDWIECCPASNKAVISRP
jgi:hypothetical protein